MTGPLPDYTRAAERAARQVIDSYSTSFGWATRLLGPRHRNHVRNIYALVRVADELVDGVAEDAGLSHTQQQASLDRLEADTLAATRTGFSANLVVHAFAITARRAGIEADLITAFFSAMRTDLQANGRPVSFSPASHDTYVHGSAEVVGLMCLRVFLCGESVAPEELARLEGAAARLGRAFQDVNFLRDLADDTVRLGRDYLGAGASLSAEEQARWVERIRDDLAVAGAAIPGLPSDCRAALRTASAVFKNLVDRLAALPPEQLYSRRVRVPDPVKATLLARAVLNSWTRR